MPNRAIDNTQSPEPCRVLITGGAGYIGSHLVRMLHHQGHDVVVFDNLSSGNAWAVPSNTLVVGDILDTPMLVATLQHHKIQTVVHLAAKSSVPESFANPDVYRMVNVDGTSSVVQACAAADVRQLIFSSTAAVYGNATHGLVREDAPLEPISPYGESKLVAEHLLAEACVHHGIAHIVFRYFNVIGAQPEGFLGQYNPASGHLLQKCLDCAHDGSPIGIFGHDYDTVDGTAERDYVHVEDIASLHIHAIRHLDAGGASLLLNAGYGQGHSVLQFIETFGAVTHAPLRYAFSARRAGDPAALIADISRLRQELSWTPAYPKLEQMIASSWLWEHEGKHKLLGAQVDLSE